MNLQLFLVSGFLTSPNNQRWLHAITRCFALPVSLLALQDSHNTILG